MQSLAEILSAMPMAANLAIFVLLASGVWLTGSWLTRLADTLSDRLDLAKSIVGLVFLATATSLPEIATTVSAALVPDAQLVLNNLFGGIALQTAILAVADFWTRGAISNYPRKANHALEATLLVFLLALLLVAVAVDEPASVLGVGLGSLLTGVAYMTALAILRRYDRNTDWVPVDLPEAAGETFPQPLGEKMADISTPAMLARTAIACVGIFLLGVALVATSETLAVQTGLGTSFVGVTLLAAATSLPELATTIAAVRLGAYTLAISNIFGSNLIMVVLVLPADMLFSTGPILRHAGVSATLAIALGILVTAVYLTGLIIRRKPRVGPIGLDSATVLAIYLASLFLFYAVR